MKFIAASNSYLVTKSWCSQLDINPSKLKVAFIDTAGEVYSEENRDWLSVDRQALIEMGFTVTDYTLTGKTKSQLVEDLTVFDVLFVSGGNTFYLLEKANLSGFTNLIKEDYFKDKIYIGSSAGSVLLSHDIDPIRFLDDPLKASLSNTKAIGIFNFVIFPHWGSAKFKPKYEKLFEYAYSKAQQGFLLADNQYIFFSDGNFQLISE